MSILFSIASIPGVKTAVIGDLDGAVAEAVADTDGETIAAVMGFTATTLAATGELLGLGPVERVSITGPSMACLITVRGNYVVTTYIDPTKPVSAIEKKLDSLLQR
jgi:predicted regulator of Ras-like GTPase activity (Roadblock/LC7/MglB family)